MVTIRRNGATVAVIEPDEGSAVEQEISGMDALRLSFSLPHYRHFAPGDTAVAHGETYYLATLPTVRREQGRRYAYRLDMEGERHKLGRARYRQANAIGQFVASPFHINGTAAEMMLLLLRNIERCFPEEGWKLGQVERTEVKNIHFDGRNCLEAIGDIAREHGTEWHAEGRTLHLARRTRATGLVLRQGPGEALYGIEARPADNSGPVNRLYAYGGAGNLPANYRNGRTRLAIGEIPYIEGDTSAGVWEGDFTDGSIFPVNEGTVTAADPDDPLRFTDAGMPFNVNDCLMPGLSAKVSFRTGQLAGAAFEMASFNWAARAFALKKSAAETAIDMPSDLFRPAVGDTYFVHDVRMPPAFVERAEQRLKQAAQRHMDERNGPEGNAAYAVECSPLWFRRNGVVLRPGDTVRLMDGEMGIDAAKRITRLRRGLRDPWAYTAELADRPAENRIVKLFAK